MTHDQKVEYARTMRNANYKVEFIAKQLGLDESTIREETKL